MARRLLARRLALTGCVCATVLAMAGCTQAGNTGTSVSGSTLSIYLSVPPGTQSQEEKDVLDAEQLAFKQSNHQLGKFRLHLVRSQGHELSENARKAIVDSSTIAYLGELAPGTSADTIGITNSQDVLQVSPTDTAVELTRSTPAIAKTPTRYYEALGTYGRTFARLVPTSAVEARVVVSQMRSVGVQSVAVLTDSSPYGAALKSAFLSAAKGSLRTDLPPSSAGAVFYAGSSATGATHVFDQTASTNAKAKLFAPSALAESSFAASLSPAAQRNLYVSSPGFTASGGPASGFSSAFQATYHRAPSPQAVFGFAAMQAVLRALQRAGTSASNRKTVVQDFFALQNFGTAVGAISIDGNGDVSFRGGAPFVFSRVKGGKLTPVKSTHG